MIHASFFVAQLEWADRHRHRNYTSDWAARIERFERRALDMLIDVAIDDVIEIADPNDVIEVEE